MEFLFLSVIHVYIKKSNRSVKLWLSQYPPAPSVFSEVVPLKSLRCYFSYLLPYFYTALCRGESVSSVRSLEYEREGT